MVKTSILGVILILALLLATAVSFFSSISPVFAQEAGVTVNPTSGLITTEAGGTDTFTIVLNTQPTANVYIELSSSNTSEGTISPSGNLVFTQGNWNKPQTITVTGVDDSIVDGDVIYNIITAAAASADSNYDGVNPADVEVTNQDNDTTVITVDPTSGLTTTEAGGTDTFTIVLNTQPTADVTIGLSSSDLTEGTISPPSMTFTSANWNSAQTATVTGVDDALVDGDIPYTIITAAASSTDPNYNGVNPDDVSVTNQDNDTTGITVDPTSGLTTTEAGGTDTFTIVLNTQPTADVTIGLSSSDLTEGTISPPSMTFTSANWNSAQTATVTGVDDDIDDGDIAYNIVTAAASSTDPNYNGVNPDDVEVTNQDNDTTGITVDLTSGLTTTEAGGTDTFTIVLNTQPTADVTIGLSSSDLTEGTISPASLTFTTGNWDTPQTTTVTGVDDDIDDGDITYNIVTAAATSTDPDYNGIDPDDVSVTNKDDEVPSGGGGGGGGGGPAPEGYNFINPYIIRLNGLLIYPFFAESEDGSIKIELAKDTICLDRYGYALLYVSIVPIDETKWPQPPADATIIVVYDFGPDGATFDPLGTLTFIYDESLITEGINEEDLVIAYWDADAEEWVVLDDCVVDPETNTITATLRHFTTFAVLGYEEEVEAPVTPATFELSSLSISSAEVEIGEEVVLSVTVTNTGEQYGNYEVTLKIDGELEETREIVDLAGGAEQTVTFTTARDADGTYTVDVNGETGTFIVKPVSPGVPPGVPPAVPTSHRTVVPAEVDIAENMTISTLVSNTSDSTGTFELTFKVDNDVVTTKNIVLASGDTEEVTHTVAFPVELNIGASAAFSTFVTNNGENTGKHVVTLKIDNVMVATKHIILPGNTSEDATFLTTKDGDNTYIISIDGQSAVILVSSPPPFGTEHWLIIVILAPIVIAGSTTFFLIRNKRFRNSALSLTGYR